jgi:hypothetical protein
MDSTCTERVPWLRMFRRAFSLKSNKRERPRKKIIWFFWKNLGHQREFFSSIFSHIGVYVEINSYRVVWDKFCCNMPGARFKVELLDLVPRVWSIWLESLSSVRQNARLWDGKKRWLKILAYFIYRYMYWYIKEIHSEISMNKTGRFVSKHCRLNQKPRHLIGQTAITWPHHAVSENRGKDHFKLCSGNEYQFL